jgi:multiple sugar transport system substrate-binding protein
MGGQWLDESREPVFNEEGGAESLEYFATLVQNYGPPGVANYGWQESLALFNDGKAAMIMDASPLFANMIDPKQSKVHEHVKALIQPEGPAGNYPTVHGWTLNMSPFSKNKEAAWLFMQWYSSKEMYKYAYSNGFPTPRKSAWNQPNAKEMAPEPTWYDATLASFEIGGFWIIPIVVAGAEVRKEIGLAVSSALEGADNYQGLLDNAADRVKNIMEKTEQ